MKCLILSTFKLTRFKGPQYAAFDTYSNNTHILRIYYECMHIKTSNEQFLIAIYTFTLYSQPQVHIKHTEPPNQTKKTMLPAKH